MEAMLVEYEKKEGSSKYEFAAPFELGER